MTAVVLLAADLIERAADPRHGPDANELAAMQLDVAVADEDVRRLIVHGPLEDPDALSLTGWLWFLEWRQGTGGEVPDRLLQVLSGRATSAEARFHLRRIVGHDPALNERALGVDLPLELPSRWLQRQVADARDLRIDPFELLRHLLQLASPLTLLALQFLIAGPGGNDIVDALRDEVTRILAQRDLADETRLRWAQSLGLPITDT